ncbi:acyl-CoA synthetase [Streptomonospora wellingtoniae]|uniref:Long-chain fatty acid--CoA ligase n=1 Tax=Streptomonospora wellingtoniae TaxID=3075544 RepID=A0ABU2KR99_9ACTN|nr:long-chain fatty acid--CoA ligase [Streptomonospora sp. DSM 45055]MDT0301702.1 long-chain fatty acid--CoA ligase [Streptomonospora sp. DSM 45055]
MRNHGIGSWPARRSRAAGARTALVHDGRSTTYRELDERSTRVARVLEERGAVRGDRVAYLGANRPEFLAAMFGSALLGAVFTPFNTRLARAELEVLAADSSPVLLLADADRRADAEALHRAGLVGGYLTVGGAGAEDDPCDLERAVAAAPGGALDRPVAHADPFLLLYTSGSTGRPKGVVLTHGNVTWNCLNSVVDTDLVGTDTALVSAPMFHTAALNMLCLPVLLKGGRLLLEERFDPERAVDLIEREGVTVTFGVPTMYERIARSPRWPDADLSALRLLLCGGAPVPPPLIDSYMRRGLAFVQGYGLTEAAPGALLLPVADCAGKAGSAGVPAFFTDVRTAEPGPGPSEVLVEGPNVTPGYWNRPAESAAALREGWLHTGDAAEVDGDGYFRIVDRVKDMYVSGGENVYPAEVEAALAAHPDVLECAVVGVPDATWGESGAALVVPVPGRRPEPADLRGFLAERLARYKIPAAFSLGGELPRNAVGKIDKRSLRSRLAGA